MVVGSVKGRLERLASNILEVDVDSLGGQLPQRIAVAGGLVVESVVELELLLDELSFLIAAHGADDGQALVLGELPGDLADGTGGGGDEDGLTLLGSPDLVEGGAATTTSATVPPPNPMEPSLGGQPGHAQSTGVVAQRQVVLVIDLLEASQLLLGNN